MRERVQSNAIQCEAVCYVRASVLLLALVCDVPLLLVLLLF